MSSNPFSAAWSRALGIGAVTLIAVPLTSAANAPIANSATVAPAPIVEKPLSPASNDTPEPQPTPQHVWVPGHWRWLEGSYVWEAGRWEVPPVPNVTWVAPQWQQQGSGYVLKEGFWQEVDPTVAAAAQKPQAVSEVVATTIPPPAPQLETIYERPTPTHVWIPGYWGWREGKHVWIAGQWVTAPKENVTWIAPRWELRGGKYVFVNGYWRENVPVSVVVPTAPPSQPGTPANTTIVTAPASPAPQVVTAPQPQQVIVVTAPPAPRHEVVYARPSHYHVWVPGYWSWQRGRYVWIAGHWSMPPRGRNSWESPRWERRGGNYIFIEGHWR